MYSLNDSLVKIIFGLKLKELRISLGLSTAELAEKTDLSVSYLNEIENGKKYPKQDKILLLADSLKISYDNLVSLKLSKKYKALTDIIESNVLQALPLELFDIKMEKIINIIANAPVKVGALISSLIEIARTYQFSQEDFYFSVLRKYQEMHENYFEEIEKAATEFLKKNDLYQTHLSSATLIQMMEEKYKISVVFEDFGSDELLYNLRSVYLKKHKKLLLNKAMNESQQRFLLMRELAYPYLQIEKNRIYVTPIDKVHSFEEALHNFQVSYFSSAVLIKKDALVEDLKKFFNNTQWQERHFFEIISAYGATPEMFFQRVVSLLPRYFHIHRLFFLRFDHHVQTDTFILNKEFHLPEKHFPQAMVSSEHYCRRWVAIRSLRNLSENRDKTQELVIQRTKEQNTGSEYLSISIAKVKDRKQDINTSVTIGLLIDKELDKHIKFWHDEHIKPSIVNRTCERCMISDCKERAFEPHIYKEQEHEKRIVEKLKKMGVE